MSLPDRADQPNDPWPDRRLTMDPSGAAADAAVRRVAAGVALAAGLWLLLVADHVVQGLFGVAALAFGALWLRRSLRPPAQPHVEACLELSTQGLRLTTASGVAALDWSETRGVALDEDRLQVLVLKEDAEPLRIEPGYGALPLRELAEMIHEYRTQQRPCIPPSDG